MTDGERLARAVLLFYLPGRWTEEHVAEWREVTGQPVATTKVLGDLARAVLAEAGHAPAPEQ